MQSWDLDRKIQVSLTRIDEWYNHFDGKVYISFSGGKDSTVLRDLVHRVHPDVPCVFVDTGLEYPEIRKFARSLPDVVVVRPEINFKQVIEQYGYPLISKEVAQKIYEARSKPDGKVAERFIKDNPHSLKYGKSFSMEKWAWLKDSDIPISHKCCLVMKKKPAKKYEKETGRKPYIGSMTCESRNRKSAWIRHGCNAFDAPRKTSNPISFWTEQDVLRYLKEYDIPYCSVYGDIVEYGGKFVTTGCDRTGCVFCAFGAHLDKEPTKFQMLKETHPKLYEYCLRPKEDHGLGMQAVFDWINEQGKINIKYQ